MLNVGALDLLDSLFKTFREDMNILAVLKYFVLFLLFRVFQQYSGVLYSYYHASSFFVLFFLDTTALK